MRMNANTNQEKKFRMKRDTILGLSSYGLVGTIALVSLVLVLTNILTRRTPLVTPDLLTQIAFTMIMVVSLNLVVNFLGELSLGHAGFMYVGAYVAGIFMYYTQTLIPFDLLRFFLSMILGGCVAMLFGFIVGLPALRLRGDYLAIVTLAFGEIVRGILKNIKIGEMIKTPAIGFNIPQFLDADFSRYLFFFAFIMVLITLFCVQNIVQSKHGRAITAIKDNEIAARAMGVNITYYKLIVFAIAAFFAGVAGAIFASYTSVSPDIFDYNYSIEFLVMVVLGGMGGMFSNMAGILGTLVSSIAVVFINVQLRSFLTGNLAGLKNLFYAMILILLMIISSYLKKKKNAKNHKNAIAEANGIDASELDDDDDDDDEDVSDDDDVEYPYSDGEDGEGDEDGEGEVEEEEAKKDGN